MIKGSELSEDYLFYVTDKTGTGCRFVFWFLFGCMYVVNIVNDS